MEQEVCSSKSGRSARGFSDSVDWESILTKKSQDARSVLLRAIAYSRSKIKFCTGSSYTGKWNALGMAVYGSYIFPQGCQYEGGFENGRFHGEGILSYPMGQKLGGLWYKGKMVSYNFWHIDGMVQEESWPYCRMPDRRFIVSIREGLRPAGREYLTNQQPTRPIETNCYDTGDGYFNVVTKTFLIARDPEDYVDLDNRESIEVVEVPDEEDDYWLNRLHFVTNEREEWIRKHCRKSWDEPVGYRPHLYPDWFTGRKKEAEQIDLKYEREVPRSEKSYSVSEMSRTSIMEPDVGPQQIYYAGTGRKLLPSSRSLLFVPATL